MVTLSTGDSQLAVTADHPVTVLGSDGEPSDVPAGDLRVLQIFTGRRFEPVIGITRCREECHVVEVCFENDEHALVWLLPAGRRRPAALDLERAFAVRGCPPPCQCRNEDRWAIFEARVRNTFVDLVEIRQRDGLRRSSSLP